MQDVADLEAERALEIPQLVPASVAEVRAAIMFTLESKGAAHIHMLPKPGHSGDLFEGLVSGVNQLPPREREVVVLRTGVGDRVHEVEDVARAIGCTVEQVPQLEKHALNALLSQPGSVEACWRLEDLCNQLGLGWEDERLPTVVSAQYPNTRASFTRLASWLMREKGKLAALAGGRIFAEPNGIAHFEEMVVAALGRYGDMSESALTNHVRAAFSPVDRELYPEVEVTQRVQILGPAVQSDDGIFRLPDEPIPGLRDKNTDRHIRALNGLIGALERLGSGAHFVAHRRSQPPPAALIPGQRPVRPHLVTRHPELFTQSDPDRFKLASLDVDILCGLSTSWMPGETAPAVAAASKAGGLAVERLHERVAIEIANYLHREGPQPIGRIRAHLYGRFTGLASADVVITQSPQRFVRDPKGVVSLRDPDAVNAADSKDAPRSAAAKRLQFWRRR